MTNQTKTKSRTCGLCKATYEGRSYNHDCRTSDLPRAIRRDGKYAMRRHEGHGLLMWVDVPDVKRNEEFAGTSYTVGAVMDAENFEAAVYEAQEEARILAAEAKAEFGF